MLLGIDIGTTNVKALLVEAGTFRVLHRQSRPLGPQEDVSIPGAAERSVSGVFNAVEDCLSGLENAARELLKTVNAIGVCGQMHGCVLWRAEGEQDGLFDTLAGALRASACSNLITWQDARCNTDFLASLPKISSDMGRAPLISAGYGCATLVWLQRHTPEMLSKYNRAGTVMDMVVSALSNGGREVLMSSQNAASWGYFDQSSMNWQKEIVTELFPVSLLPGVVEAPHVMGQLVSEWHGVQAGTRVLVAMGDMQCSVLATKPTLTDAVLNMGSASQISVVKPPLAEVNTASPSPGHPPPSIVELPYFNNHHLLVSASLSGGDTLALFVRTLQSWFADLGSSTHLDFKETYERVMELAAAKIETQLRVDPRVCGERHAPEERGRVWGVRPDNVTLGDVGSAVVRGIVENLRDMISPKLLKHHQVKRVLGSGKLLQSHAVFQEHISGVFNLPLILREEADAPLGAAMAASQNFNLNL